MSFNTDVTQDDKLWALLSYLFAPVIPIVVLLMDDKKNRPFLKLHAVQALALFVVELIASVVIVGACLYPFYFVYMIYLGVKAYKGETLVVPVLTDFIKKQGWV